MGVLTMNGRIFDYSTLGIFGQFRIFFNVSIGMFDKTRVDVYILQNLGAIGGRKCIVLHAIFILVWFYLYIEGRDEALEARITVCKSSYNQLQKFCPQHHPGL